MKTTVAITIKPKTTPTNIVRASNCVVLTDHQQRLSPMFLGQRHSMGMLSFVRKVKMLR